MIDYRENNKYLVYIHIFPKHITGYSYDKYYVGITGLKPNRRWRKGEAYNHNKHFYNAIQKYGWDNIEHEIVAEHLTKDEAYAMERALIKELNCFNTIYGYNQNSGGDGCHDHIYTEEQKKEISLRVSGTNNPFYGKKHSEQSKNLISLNHYNCSGGNNSASKKTYQFTLNGEFVAVYDCCKYASKVIGTSSNNLCIKIKNNKPINGFLFMYEDNVILLNDGSYKIKEYKYTPKEKSKAYCCKEVYQFDIDGRFIKRYESCQAASEETNVLRRTISDNAKNKRKQVKNGNYIWRYKEDIKESEENPGFFIMLR